MGGLQEGRATKGRGCRRGGAADGGGAVRYMITHTEEQ